MISFIYACQFQLRVIVSTKWTMFKGAGHSSVVSKHNGTIGVQTVSAHLLILEPTEQKSQNPSIVLLNK